jgi:hypothetical protein
MGLEPASDSIGGLTPDVWVNKSHLYEPVVHVFTHGGEVIDLSPYCNQLETDKRWESGTWEVTVKARAIGRGLASGANYVVADEHHDWFDRITAGDWAMIAIRIDRHTYPLMIGPVKGIHRTRQGLQDSEIWVISGGDHGYPLEVHEIISLPQFKAPEGMDAVLADGAFYKTIGKMTRIWDQLGGEQSVPAPGQSFGISPSDIVQPLALFFLGHWRQTDVNGTPYQSGATPAWETPPIFPVPKPPDLPAGWAGAPLGDLLRFKVEPTDGRAVIQEVMAGLPRSPLWDYLHEWANPAFNEFWCDLLPAEFGQRPMTPDDYRRPMTALDAGDFPWDLAVCLRPKPFPSWARVDTTNLGYAYIPDRPSGVARWRGLPVTTFDERQFNHDSVMTSDEHRKNFFLCLPHESYGASPYTLALGAAGQGRLPIIAREDGRSARTVGWRRQEDVSKYMPTDGIGMGTYYLWSRQLADWSARAHEHMGGSFATTHMYPGVRVGERINVARAKGAYVEYYYCEGVSHSWSRSDDGKDAAVTTMSATRGMRDILGGVSATPPGLVETSDPSGTAGAPLTTWPPGERPV